MNSPIRAITLQIFPKLFRKRIWLGCHTLLASWNTSGFLLVRSSLSYWAWIYILCVVVRFEHAHTKYRSEELLFSCLAGGIWNVGSIFFLLHIINKFPNNVQNGPWFVFKLVERTKFEKNLGRLANSVCSRHIEKQNC